MADGSKGWMPLIVGLVLVATVVNTAMVLRLSARVDALREAGDRPARDPLVDNDAIKGDPEAPVTLVEFTDYQCPFCARYFAETYPRIQERYVETGKVRMVVRDFPLDIHPEAQKAAEAAECAGEQERYWEMHDVLFENQDRLGVDQYKAWAGDLGLDQARFDECLDSGAMAMEVRADLAAGLQYGIRGTPAFFINGRALFGAQPFELFEAIIEEELAAAAGAP